MKKKSLSLEIPSLTMEGNISMYTALMDNTFHTYLCKITQQLGGGSLIFNIVIQDCPIFCFIHNFAISTKGGGK